VSPLLQRVLRRSAWATRRAALRASPADDPLSLSDDVDVAGQAASDLIRDRVAGDAPALIGRVGLVELECLLNYLSIKAQAPLPRKLLDFVRGRAGPFWWDPATTTKMRTNGGFFPTDARSLERFCEQMLADLPLIDVLGSWLRGEELLRPYLGDVVRVRLADLEPYYHASPWTEALTGKSVLVVHPFAESIESQYARRAQLFADARLLPAFELKTVKAVQSIAGAPTGYRTWFDALDAMADEIAGVEFDVAIVGCGAYGLPLAAHVKRLGRKAVHLGGAVQILFGIRGRRWDQHEFVSTLVNQFWVRPRPAEHPPEYASVEGGCYW